MGLILCAVILVAVYVLKIFFPHFVIEVAQIESVTVVGHYIDTHKWAWYLTNSLLAFITYFLLICTTCQKTKLNKKDFFWLFLTMLIVELSREILPKQYTALNLSSLIVLPLLVKGDFKITVIWFVCTCLLQTITLEIRNLVTMISDINSATALILTIDVYILEILLCFAFNYKKGGV